MAPKILQSARSVWQLVDRQHGVVTRSQLLDLGYSAEAVKHRLATGRLRRIRPGIYAVGRSQVSLLGCWMAGVLSCGPTAALSHATAASLFNICPVTSGPMHVSVSAEVARRRPGIVVHRRTNMEVTRQHGIPVTTPVSTLVDIAQELNRDELEAAINEADKRDLVKAQELRSALDSIPPRPGIAILRETLERRTFTFTDSALERHFLPIARRAGLGMPKTQHWVNGFKVDFYWPDLGLVVETHGWRYHRTPAQQSRDLRREHVHTAAGLTPLSFTHGQVRYEPGHVQAILGEVAVRLRLSKSPA